MIEEQNTGDVSKSLVSYLKDEGVVDAIRPLAEQKDKVEKIANMVRERVEGKRQPPIEEALWSFLPVLRHAQEPTKTRKELSWEEFAQVLGFGMATNQDFENPAVVMEMKEWAEGMRDLYQGLDGIRALSIFTGLFMLHGPSLSLYLFLVCSLAFDMKKGIQTFKEAWETWLTQAMKEGSPKKDQKCVTAFVNVAVRTVAAGVWTLELAMEGGISLKSALEDLLGVKAPLSQSLEDKQQWNEYMGRVVKHFGSLVEPIAGILKGSRIEVEMLHQYATAMGELRDLIAEEEASLIPSVKGDHWPAQLWGTLLEAVDHMVTTVVKASGDCSRRSALLEKVQASLKGLPGLVGPRKPMGHTSPQLEDEERQRYREAMEKRMDQRARMRTAVRELLESRLNDVSGSFFLNGGDAMVQEIQSTLLSVGQSREPCTRCSEPNPRNRCSVCLMLILCGEDDSGKKCYETVKDLLLPRNEVQYLFFRDIIDSEFKHILEDKVAKITEEISDLQGEVRKLEDELQRGAVPNEAKRKEIEQRIQEDWPEDLKRLFKDRLENIQNADAKELERRQKLECKPQGDSLVISKYALKVSEVNQCLQQYSRDKYEELVLVGELEIITDAKLPPLPGINVTVLTRTIRLEEGGCEQDAKGGLTFTIDTSGRHGSPGENGRYGADYGANGHKGESEDGEDGEPGGDGTPGQSAGHVYLKVNTFLGGKIVILANGGNGGNGGDGGNGGRGKKGKDGGDGDTGLFARRAPRKHPRALLAYPTSCPVAPGRGGNAGRPGARGGGGYKGDVDFPDGIRHLVQVYAEDGKAGVAGKVGTPGKPGHGGRIGKGYLRVWETEWTVLHYIWAYREESACMPDTSLWAARNILGCRMGAIESPKFGLYLSNATVENAGFPRGMPSYDDTLVNGRVVSRDSLKGQKAEANQAVVSAQKKAKSNLDSSRYAGDNADLKGAIEEILEGGEAATDRRDQNETAEFSRNVNAFVSAAVKGLPTLSLIDMINSIKCKTHIQMSQAHQQNTFHDSANRYQAPSLSPQWPRIGSCGLLSEIQGMPAFKAYTDYLADGAGNLSFSTEFAGCCAKLIRELYEEHQGELAEGYAQFFAEKLFEAIQTHLKAEKNYEALLKLYISLGGEGDTVHIGPIRQACLRQLYVAHVEGLWCGQTDVDEKALALARRDACHLRICNPSCYNELVRESGACVMCPQNVLSALREPPSEWEEKMKKFGMDIRQLILSTLGKHQITAREEPCVVEVYENFKKGLRDSPDHEIWTEEATLCIFQWLGEINQEKAEEIRHIFFGLFVGENETYGTLFLDERNLREGVTVGKALRLLLAWAHLLLGPPELSGEGLLKCFQALLHLCAADKLSLEELFEREGPQPPLWLRVAVRVAAEAEFEELEGARKRLSEPTYKTPNTAQPTGAQRFLLSILNTAEWWKLFVIVQEALERAANNGLVRLKTCLCKYFYAPLAEESPEEEAGEGGSNEYSTWDEDEGWKVLRLLMSKNRLLIPSPACCPLCLLHLEKSINEAYKVIGKCGVGMKTEVAERLELEVNEMNHKAFMRKTSEHLERFMRASRSLHCIRKSIRIHEKQCELPDDLGYAQPELFSADLMQKLRSIQNSKSAEPTPPISLKALLDILCELEEYLMVHIPVGN